MEKKTTFFLAATCIPSPVQIPLTPHISLVTTPRSLRNQLELARLPPDYRVVPRAQAYGKMPDAPDPNESPWGSSLDELVRAYPQSELQCLLAPNLNRLNRLRDTHVLDDAHGCELWHCLPVANVVRIRVPELTPSGLTTHQRTSATIITS